MELMRYFWDAAAVLRGAAEQAKELIDQEQGTD
jgi:hypothetical protein